MGTRPLSDAGLAGRSATLTDGPIPAKRPHVGAACAPAARLRPPGCDAPIADAELMERLCRQDSLAQRQLVAYYLPVLSGFVEHRFRLVAADAEDVAVDVLVALLSAPHRFEAARGVRLRNWLLRVTANRAIDLLRKRALAAEVDLTAEAVCPEAVPLSVGAGLSLARLAEEVCETFSVEQQQILWWYAYKVPHGTIAAWVGKSEEAVRQTVARLKREVARRLAVRVNSLPADQRQVLEARMAAFVPRLGARTSGSGAAT